MSRPIDYVLSEPVVQAYSNMTQAMNNVEELTRLLADNGVSEPHRAQDMMKLTAQAVDAASSATYDLFELMEGRIVELVEQTNKAA